MHSNFITPPDFVETVLIVDSTQDQALACAEAIKTAGTSYNVYFYNEEMNDPVWFERVSTRADIVIDAKITNPLEYFNK